MNQLYQINYRCWILGGTVDFTVNPLDAQLEARLFPPIASLSITVAWRVFIKAVATYVLTSGWQRIAIYGDYDLSKYDVSRLLQSVTLSLTTTAAGEPLYVLDETTVHKTTNFTRILEPLEYQLDGKLCRSFHILLSLNEDLLVANTVLLSHSAILLVCTADLAASLMRQIQNMTRIKEGRIAILNVNLGDMYTYDALISWKSALMESSPQLAAGQSLLIVTALPFNAEYEEESFIYEEASYVNQAFVI